MRRENKDEDTVLLKEHLKGRVFYFFYDVFAEDDQLAKEGQDYKK